MNRTNGSTVRRLDTNAPLIEDDTSQSCDSTKKNGAPTSKSRQQERGLFYLAGIDSAKPDPSIHHADSAKFAQFSFLSKVFNESQSKRKTNTVNNQPLGSAKAMERYVAVQQEIMRAIESDDTVFSHYFEQLNSLRATSKEYARLFERDMAYYRTSSTKQLWNLFAGAMAFALCFGPGTLTSDATCDELVK
jgi:hypothetical protein